MRSEGRFSRLKSDFATSSESAQEPAVCKASLLDLAETASVMLRKAKPS
jgi:hypothetical protein